MNNITPATNFAELTVNARKHVADYNQYRTELDNGTREWRGYFEVSMPTAVIYAVAEYGAENIFQIMEDYHGLYEDDYCYFTYWNNITGEEFKDTWTTACGCPPYSSYEWLSFEDGWNNNLVDKMKYIEYRKKYLTEEYENLTPIIDWEDVAEMKLKVVVDGGKKWKGIGYLIGLETKSYRYATPIYRNHADDYGVSTTVTAKIYDPKTNTIQRANIKYVKLANREDVNAAYEKWIMTQIENLNINSFVFARSGNGIAVALNNFYTDFPEFIVMVGDRFVGPASIAEDANDPVEEERRRKKIEYKTKQIASLVEWVKEKKPEMTDEFEIYEFAERIFNKNKR